MPSACPPSSEPHTDHRSTYGQPPRTLDFLFTLTPTTDRPMDNLPGPLISSSLLINKTMIIMNFILYFVFIFILYLRFC